MPDPLDDTLRHLLRDLRDQPPPAGFAPTTQVRRRGAQRTRRMSFVAGVAVLAVVGSGLATVTWNRASTPPSGAAAMPGARPSAGPTTPGPSPSPSGGGGGTSEASSRLTASMTIQPIDLGPGLWRPVETKLFSSLRWRWAELCDRAPRPTALAHQIELKTASFESTGMVVSEILERYDEGWAARSLDDVRSVLSACTDRANRYIVTDAGLAADESILVRIEQRAYLGDTLDPEPIVRFATVARVGDLVITIVPGTQDVGFVLGVTTRAIARVT